MKVKVARSSLQEAVLTMLAEFERDGSAGIMFSAFLDVPKMVPLGEALSGHRTAVTVTLGRAVRTLADTWTAYPQFVEVEVIA